jgi:hypothetical protein
MCHCLYLMLDKSVNEHVQLHSSRSVTETDWVRRGMGVRRMLSQVKSEKSV